MSAAIVCENLGKTYSGGQVALHGVNLAVDRGEVFGFLGPNGAGKTTTIKLILGLQLATAGRVAVFGEDPARAGTRARLGYLPEVANYYEFLNVRELLSFYGKLCGMSAARIRTRTDQLLQMTGLGDRARTPLKHFSKGMLQRAGICQALLHDPELLILDEPTTGLDPLARLQMRDIILALRQEGKTVFFSSHELSEVEVVCDRVAILCSGTLRWCGRTVEVAGEGDENLERKFLKIIGGGQPGETAAAARAAGGAAS